MEAARVIRWAIALGVLLAFVGCGEEEPLLDLSAGRPNVVFIGLDSFRADHLGCYGNDHVETPHIDALAAESILFERCSSNAPWTLPSFASIFTGRLPSTHRAVGGPSKQMSRDLPTLAEIFAAHGYTTLGSMAVDWLGTAFGLNRGFQRLHTTFEGKVSGRYERSLEALFNFLRRGPVEPHFVFAHIYDAHAPYDPPPPFDGMYYDGDPFDPSKDSTEPLYLGSNRIQKSAAMRYGWLSGVTDIEYPVAQYAAGISHVDRGVGAVLDSLRTSGQLEKSIVILTADHGEHLTEHSIYFTHRFPYEECLHVPFMIRLPGGIGAGRRISEEVSLVDLMPTLLELVALPPPDTLDGISLVPLMRGKRQRGERIHFAEYGATPRNHVRAVWDRDFRLIDFNVGDERWLELYDRAADRSEETNIVEERADERERLLRELLWRFPTGAILDGDVGDSTAGDVDTEVEKRLRALGYID